MDWLSQPESWIALLTLTSLEIVLGIDNIIFISILAGKLPEKDQDRARRIGLMMAMFTRILLLFSLSWLTSLTTPFMEIGSFHLTGRALILVIGGLFLLAKATFEIHEKLEGEEHDKDSSATVSFASVILQITLLDIVFSLDSVITAVGMVDQLAIMVIAVVIAVLIMLWAAGPISDFVNERPTIKILALSFLLLIGFSLVAEGLEFHIPKGYIYFAMGFSVFVEVLNIQLRKRVKPIQLRNVPKAKQDSGK
jgi:predicted tellurium resistance membrane protein TerC